MNTRSSVKDIRCAIRKNQVHAVRSILQRNPEVINPSCIDLFEGMLVSPFWEALLSGNEKIVDVFLDFKARPDEPFPIYDSSFYGLTFLHYLNFFDDVSEKNLRVARLLIKRGADVNALNKQLSQTVLQTALQKGKVDYAEFLLRNGARLNGPKGHTRGLINYVLDSPKSTQARFLQTLVEHGMNLDLRNSNGYDLVQFVICRASGRPEGVDYLKIVKILVENGVPVNRSNHLGASTLYLSLRLQDPKLVSMLINRGADVNFRYTKRRGFFPLFVAVRKNNVRLVALLLASGADVNAKIDDGRTVLHQACYHRNETIVALLLQKGAAFSPECRGDLTPFSFLKPEAYRGSDISCINAMVKEMAKRRYVSACAVSEKDMKLVHSHPVVLQIFQNRTKELERMQRTKFYGSYSYFGVLDKSLKKLKKLAKNTEFVGNFSAGLHDFPFYKKDLRRILEEAIKARDKTAVVEWRLMYVFGNHLPDVVRRILAEHLTVEDLPLENIIID